MDFVQKLLKKDSSVSIGPTSISAPTGQNTSRNVSSNTSHSPQNSLFWKPPPQVKPKEEIVTGDLVDVGVLESNALLYEIVEEDGGQKHSLLSMPSEIPAGLRAKATIDASKYYNILMADVSGSMRAVWPAVVHGWNKFVGPTLHGRTDIYTFGSTVIKVRTGTKLEKFDHFGGGTDLTGALRKIVEEIHQCKEMYVNVFLITDGHHNDCSAMPDTVIDQMVQLQGKTCSVYVLGVGCQFPVQYSIEIRSRLHNGSAKVPTLFWSKEVMMGDNEGGVMEQLKDIGKKLSEEGVEKLHLSVLGSTMPHEPGTKSFHVGEWVYCQEKPEELTDLTLTFQGCKGHLNLTPREPSLEVLANVFKQWNSVLIQKHNTKQLFSLELLTYMERIFNHKLKQIAKAPFSSISNRLEKKNAKNLEMDFRNSLKKLKAILTTEKFKDELELADKVISTTVNSSKYSTRALELKGHTDADYTKDCQVLLEILKAHQTDINSVTDTPEECCRITMSSTVRDLQDEDFNDLLELNKYEFLKTFTLSGIPVFAPTRDSVVLNPWSYSIRRMLTSPYTVMSQVAIETYAHAGYVGEQHKDIKLKDDDDNTHFNAVVPVFSPETAKVMEPLVLTRLYAMCATFAIVKNPHIIDFNIHMAALGVCWVRILYEHPNLPRPEYVRIREENIAATANIYLSRKAYSKYCRALKEQPNQALMTESELEFDDKKTLKCETLVKPMFMLMLLQRRNEVTQADIEKIVHLIVVEYVGRCLSRYEGSYSDLFLESFEETDKKKKWIEQYVQDTKDGLAGQGKSLLSKYYTLEEAQKSAKKLVKEQVSTLLNKLMSELPLRVKKEKVEVLRNLATAGDISWTVLKTFARDVGLSTDFIENIFNEKSIFIYTAHALQHRASRARLSANIFDYENAYKFVEESVQKENLSNLSKDLEKELHSCVVKSWLDGYNEVHTEVVKPMSRNQIIAEATKQGISVTETNFDSVYPRYRPDVGLLHNACQTRACPFFLKPNKRYNMHAVVERKVPSFPHGLHQAAYQCRKSDLYIALRLFQNGTYRQHDGKNKTLVVDLTVVESDFKQLQLNYRENSS